MPGEEIPPRIDVANLIAYEYNFTGKRSLFLDQFPVNASTDKVQKFCNTEDASNLSIRFDNTQFPE
ncbi:MAG: hypothetical protein KAJ07_09720 [Planctomycetes bacterium]|nr:hypothetical protein [Planctomycetota bacterium]